MNEARSRPWFAAKKHGWGWGLPLTWQGWLASAVYLVLVAAGVVTLERGMGLGVFLLYLATVSAAFLALCWLKGEKPGWR